MHVFALHTLWEAPTRVVAESFNGGSKTTCSWTGSETQCRDAVYTRVPRNSTVVPRALSSERRLNQAHFVQGGVLSNSTSPAVNAHSRVDSFLNMIKMYLMFQREVLGRQETGNKHVEGGKIEVQNCATRRREIKKKKHQWKGDTSSGSGSSEMNGLEG